MIGRDRHVIVVDLGFGDAGKGTVVDWLCADREVGAVVRFNGGAQAAHNVVTADGRHHTFAQFGSGALSAVATHLSRWMLVEPLALAAEAEHLAELGVGDAFDRLTVDGQALLTTPWHRAANRVRERARGAGRHGSCGMGVGETAAYALAHPHQAPTVGDCLRPRVLADKLTVLARRLEAELGPLDAPPVAEVVTVFGQFATAARVVDGGHLGGLLDRGPVVFEGAQGVLLDEWAGFHPYTTWSTTTFGNAEALLAEHGHAGRGYRLGVVRTYTTRHGAGPLPAEDAVLAARLPEPHNGSGLWQGAFRVGHFDAVAHRYAMAACGGADGLAVTHVDSARRARPSVCEAYRLGGHAIDRLPVDGIGDLGRQERLAGVLSRVEPVLRPGPDDADEWPALVGKELGAPVVLASYGPTAADKRVIEAV